jgi:hypothetical protein
VIFRTSVLLFGFVLAALCVPAAAAPTPKVLYGIQDDAWLLGGPGAYGSRLRFLRGSEPMSSA